MVLKYMNITRFLANIIDKGWKFMKKRTVLRVFLTILLVIILLPFFFLSLNYCVYNYEDIMNKTVNIPISETCDNELDVYREIIEKCSQEIDQKPLTKVKTEIEKGIIRMTFYFDVYVDSTAEGGRIKETVIEVDFLKKQIVSIENFNGSSKGRSGSIEPITDLTELNYKTALLRETTFSNSKITTLDITQLHVLISYYFDHTNVI